MDLFFIILLYIIAVGDMADISDDEDRIIGGMDAFISDYPYFTLLNMGIDTNFSMCGGSIIATRWILTAAHCISNYRPIEVFAIMGINNQSSDNAIIHAVDLLLPHDDYDNRTLKNDIGLVYLKSNITLDWNVQIISLPSENYVVKDDEYFIVIGFGKTHYANPYTSVNLNQVLLKSISRIKCKLHWHHFVSNTTLCLTGNDYRSTCQGDSGGPVLTNINGVVTLVAVVSFGPIICGSGAPTGYVLTAPYIDWIRGWLLALDQ